MASRSAGVRPPTRCSWAHGRVIRNFLADVTKYKNEQEKRIETITGGVLRMWSLDNPDAIRGGAYHRLVIDEAAQVPNLRDAWENVLRPTLTDYEGDCYFFSTPKGRNFFWDLWLRGQDSNPEWSSWVMPSSINPHLSPSEIEAAQAELPERVFAQEYKAEFLEDTGAIFRNVQAAITAEPSTRAEHEGHHVGFGVDWGKSEDFTAVIGVCADCASQVYFDRFNQIDYHFQRRRLAGSGWDPDYILAESNAMGEPIIEELQREGLPVVGFATTAVTKPPLIEGLAVAIEKGHLALLDEPIQTNELIAMTVKTSSTGRPKYEAPDGYHDDCVIALALAWKAAVGTRHTLA